MVAFTTFLFVNSVTVPGFVPLMTVWLTEAMPGPSELITGNEVVLRMKLLALLDSDAVALNGPAPDRLLASILVLTMRNEPDNALLTRSPPPAAQVVPD